MNNITTGSVVSFICDLYSWPVCFISGLILINYIRFYSIRVHVEIRKTNELPSVHFFHTFQNECVSLLQMYMLLS